MYTNYNPPVSRTNFLKLKFLEIAKELLLS